MDRPAVRVLVVGAHPIVRGIVRVACGGLDDVEVADEAATLADARTHLERIRPELVALDVDLPDGNGLDLLREIADGGFDPAPKVLLISDRTDGAAVLEGLRLGAAGYLTRSEGMRGITGALRGIIAGERVVPPELEGQALVELGRFARKTRDGAAAEGVLTKREREVLEHLAEGLTTQQIGRRLAISPRTVETHVSHIYRKLDVTTRIHAVSRAASLGLVEL